MASRKASAKGLLKIFIAAWVCIWLLFAAGLVFGWKILPPDKFHKTAMSEVPILLMFCVCVPFLTLLPLASEVRKHDAAVNAEKTAE